MKYIFKLVTEGTMLLSGVICCGPASAKFSKPVIIQFEHCAVLQSSAWEFSIWSGILPEDNYCFSKQQLLKWSKLVSLGEETINTPVFAQIDSSNVFLMTEQMRVYALAGRIRIGATASLRLQISVYLDQDYLRVYATQETQSAKQALQKHECGQLMDRPQSVILEATAGRLQIVLEDPATNSTPRFLELANYEVWERIALEPIACFQLKGISATRSLRLRIDQIGVNEQQTLLFRVSLEAPQQFMSNKGHGEENIQPVPEIIQTTVTSTSGSIEAKTLTPFRMKKDLRTKLCQCLDPPNALGNDWRMLAQMLHVDRWVSIIVSCILYSETESFHDHTYFFK